MSKNTKPGVSRAYLDLMFGVAMLVLLALVWWVLIPVGIVVPSNIDVAALSPDFWPRTIVLLALVASILVVLQAWRDMRMPSRPEDSDEEYYPLAKALARVMLVPVGVLAVYYSMDIGGIVFGSMLLLGVLIVMAGEKRWWLVLANAVILPMLLFGFFTELANVPLPLGLFEQFR